MSGPGAAATVSAGVTHRSAIRRWFVLAPALAGILLCAIGGALVTPTSDGGLPAYLCVLIGGWAVAFSAVNALSGWEERWQWAGHIALTAGAFALAVSITPLIQEAATLPEPWGRSLAVVALGIPPCGRLDSDHPAGSDLGTYRSRCLTSRRSRGFAAVERPGRATGSHGQRLALHDASPDGSCRGDDHRRWGAGRCPAHRCRTLGAPPASADARRRAGCPGRGAALCGGPRRRQSATATGHAIR